MTGTPLAVLEPAAQDLVEAQATAFLRDALGTA
jgi:hypothetical protein